jgi:hypothetical protein
MASLPARTPLPPFPRWTGMHLNLGPHRISLDGAAVVVNVSVSPVTYRARVWFAWRALTSRGVPDAAADR